MTKTRFYLTVPFAQKDEAKSLGESVAVGISVARYGLPLLSSSKSHSRRLTKALVQECTRI